MAPACRGPRACRHAADEREPTHPLGGARAGSPADARDGLACACDAASAAETVGAVSGISHVPVFAKLSAEAGDLVAVATACVTAGASGLTLVNGLPGIAVDSSTGRPRLGGVVGRLS